MPIPGSTLLLTLLLAVGLVFFLRAASKDRTTVVEVHSPRPPLEVLQGLTQWLLERGWSAEASDPDRRWLSFRGQVRPVVLWRCCCPCWRASAPAAWAW